MESSVSLWMHVLDRTVEEAGGLLNPVYEHGSVKSQHSVAAFQEPVAAIGSSSSEAKVYRAMLIRYRFSPICNVHVIQNYESLPARDFEFHYHDTSALLECGQGRSVGPFDFGPPCKTDCEALVPI